MIEKFIVPPNSKLSIAAFDPTSTENLKNETEIKEEVKELEKQIEELQDLLYAQKKYSLLIILQGMDCSGKDEVIKHVMCSLNPNGCNVYPFKPPTDEEKSHDFLWRAHAKTPGKGYISIFDRSYYEDVLISKVHNWISEEECLCRYEHINAFERLMTYNNTIILKFFLHISPEEQLKKIRERMSIESKKWKFDKSDLQERTYWNQYMEAYQNIFCHCNTEAAPWRIIPSNHKWFRNYIILKTLVETLKGLQLEYPKMNIDFDIGDVK